MNRKMLVAALVCIGSFLYAADTPQAVENEYFPESCASVDLDCAIAVIQRIKHSDGMMLSHHPIITSTHWGLCFETIKELCESGSEHDVRKVLNYFYVNLWSKHTNRWEYAASLNAQKYGFMCDFRPDAIIAAAYKGNSLVAKKSG